MAIRNLTAKLQTPRLIYWHIALGVSLFLLLSGIYSLTYNGLPISNDEKYLFDSTQDFVRRGSLDYTYSFDLLPYIDSAGAPALKPAAEPLQVLLAAPLFWIAQHLPDVGLMHSTFLLNIFATALTGVLLYAAGLWMGYRPSIAWLGALLFGIGTLAWPYSRFFFREPLMAFFTLGCFVGAWAIRKNWQHIPRWVIAFFAISFLGAFLTKVIILEWIPCLLIIAIPLNKTILKNRRMILILVGMCIALVFLLFVLSRTGINRYNFLRTFYSIDWQYVAQSLIGYQVSPGMSVWLFSPILLFALWGAYRLIRSGQWYLAVSPILAILIISVSYGITTSSNWWGGIGLGPRFLIPLIPVLMLWIFPALDWLLQPGRRLIWKVGVALLAALSISVQLLGLAVSSTTYYQRLGEAQIIVWQQGLWSWNWSPIPQRLQLLNFNALDTPWMNNIANPGWLPPLMAILLGASGVGVVLWLRQHRAITGSTLRTMIALTAVGVVITCGTILYSLRSDPRYTNNRSDLMQLISQLDAVARPQDAIFLENKDHQQTFMNYFKAPSLLMSLPFAPGEKHGPDEIPQVVSDNPADLLGPGSTAVMDWAASHYPRLWLVMGYGPFLRYTLRPAEHYLVDHYFPIQEIKTSEIARAIAFDPTKAPTGQPSIAVNEAFGGQITLDGFDLPKGRAYKPGQVIPVSLVWRPIALVATDYNVSVQVVDQNGNVVAQRDGSPQGTFGYTSQWKIGQTYRDNHGLQLPDTLAPGNYALQVILYTWQDGKRLEVASANGEALGNIAKLGTLTIQ